MKIINPQTGLALFLMTWVFFCGSCLVVARIFRDLRTRDQSEASRALSVNNCPWSLREFGFIILWLLVALLGFILLGMFLGSQKILETENRRVLFQLGSTLFLYIQFFVSTLHLFRNKNLALSRAFGLQTGSPVKVLIAAGVVLASVYPPMILMENFMRQVFEYYHWPLQPQPILQMFLKLDHSWVLGGMVLIALVGAPIFEETLFRGMLYPCLKEKFGFHRALGINSAAFAASHLHLPSLIPLFILAMMLTLLYEWRGNLMACILCHSGFNALSLGLLFLGK